MRGTCWSAVRISRISLLVSSNLTVDGRSLPSLFRPTEIGESQGWAGDAKSSPPCPNFVQLQRGLSLQCTNCTGNCKLAFYNKFCGRWVDFVAGGRFWGTTKHCADGPRAPKNLLSP